MAGAQLCHHAPPMPHTPGRSELPALLALFAGALAIGSSGIFVRLSETGPTATAFWRGCLALPLLALWAWLERRGGSGRMTSFEFRVSRFVIKSRRVTRQLCATGA